ncbi:FAD-dependent oxidoreductase [Mesorhizobium sp. 128a]
MTERRPKLLPRHSLPSSSKEGKRRRRRPPYITNMSLREYIQTRRQPTFRDLVRNTDMAACIAARTLRMLPGLGLPRMTNVYPGNRPMLSDGLPVDGRTAIEGLYVHCGMGSIGRHAAPATARWVADAVLSGDDNPKQIWLRPQRFAGWEG